MNNLTIVKINISINSFWSIGNMLNTKSELASYILFKRHSLPLI